MVKFILDTNPRMDNALSFLRLVEQLKRDSSRKDTASQLSPVHDPSNTDYPLCVNCGKEIASANSVLYCSDLCNQETAFVRYTRGALKDGRTQDPDVLENGIGVRLLHLYGGGYPERNRHLSAIQKKKILERDGYKCCLCGKPATDIDHINDSSDDPSNLQALCRECNLGKMNIQVIPPELREKVQTQKRNLAERVAAERPLRACDNDATWKTDWPELQKQRKGLLRSMEEGVEPIDEGGSGFSTVERMVLFGESWGEAEMHTQEDNFFESDYFAEIMNRDD